MKNKLAILALLSMSAPLFALISDAEYNRTVQAELQNFQSPTDLVDQKMREQIEANPLFYFASAGNLPVVQYLIEVKGENPNQTVFSPLTNGLEVTPLDLARIYGNDDIVEYLTPYTGKMKL